jgi:hypothetical protein
MWLLPFIHFVCDLIVLFLLFKYVFKLASINIWTLAGVLFVGSLLSTFFNNATLWWLGILVYLALVGVALYKKFNLSFQQVVISLVSLIVVAGIFVFVSRALLYNIGVFSY